MSPLDRLIRIRKVLGISQRALAKEFGVSFAAVGLWESGDREIPGPVLRLIEMYEAELYPGSQTGNGEAVQETARALTGAFAETARVTDGSILASLHSAFANYAEDLERTTPMGERIRTQALRRLVESLGDARGIPMKMAQILAFLDPRLPAEMHDILESVQNHGRTMPAQTLERIFSEEFDRGPCELFQEFSRRPVASASIGQIHRARLSDGTSVAVKVLHPEMQLKIEKAFREPEFIAQLSAFLGNAVTELEELIADLHATAKAECDFELEAANQEFLRAQFLADDEIIIPRVIASHSRSRVLTMEWIDGQNWTQFRQSAGQADRDRAAKTISRFYAQSTFVHGVIQADPHPGNYLFQNGRVAFLDFGRVKKISAPTQMQMHQLHSLLMNKDKEGVRHFVSDTSLFRIQPEFNFERFWEIASEISRHLQKNSDVPFSQDLLGRHRLLLKEMSRSGMIRISPDFFWTMIFTHTLMIAGRVDLAAAGNWRQILNQGGVEGHPPA